jgi:L-seryl-tRNA(Ser) seleniumtransferase
VLTGAEAALIVNNNAAGLLLALAAIASGRAVPVSRGELIEIGGAYRLPEVIQASGARLVEVGTTNRTRIEDYLTATQVHDCGALLEVHPSNYTIEGFTQTASTAELADLSRQTGLPLIHDIGSGVLDLRGPWTGGVTPDWLAGEPGARQSLEDGADLVLFSGDKILGGPQSGIVVGRAELVNALRSHPLARALRVDGVTLAALAATLEAYADGDVSRIPFWAMATTPPDSLATRARALADALHGSVRPGHSAIGAGSAPGSGLPTTLVVLEGEDRLFGSLLARPTPVLSRRAGGALILDPRTMNPEDDAVVVESVLECR